MQGSQVYPGPSYTPVPGIPRTRPYQSFVVAAQYSMLCNRDSGPEVVLPGRISTGYWPGKPQNRPSDRPKAGRRADCEAFPVRIRPKSGSDRLPARKHSCVRSGNVIFPHASPKEPFPRTRIRWYFSSSAGQEELHQRYGTKMSNKTVESHRKSIVHDGPTTGKRRENVGHRFRSLYIYVVFWPRGGGC